jgi:predicted acetyltransferase
MTGGVDLRPLGRDDLEQYFDVRSQAFGVPADQRREWIDRMAGAPELGAVGAFAGSRLLGALRVLPGGQFVGGRSVPMGGIAAVVVRPEARGAGIARSLLSAAVVSMRERGIALSSLHPASTRVYRSAGWEIAGRAGFFTIPTRSLAAIRGDAAGGLEPLGASDHAAVHECFRTFAGALHGAVDRSPSFWWLHEAREDGEGTYRYGVRSGGRLTGYVVYTQRPSDPWGYSIRVDDLAATDRASAVAIWRFLGGHSMQVPEVTAHLAALPGLLLLLDEQDAVLAVENGWMHRIVDLPAALAARSAPTGLHAEVVVAVDDPLPDASGGVWRLTAVGGAVHAERAAEHPDAVRVDVGALSALAIGGTNAAALATAGRLAGAPEAIDALAAIVAAPAPVMTDDF